MIVGRPGDATRSVGIWLLIGADALFTLTFVYILSYGIRGQSTRWPDVAEETVLAQPLLPLLSVGAVLAAALLHRVFGPRGAAAGLVVALGLLLTFLRTTHAGGLTWNVGAYGAVVYLAAFVLMAHAAAALVGAVLAWMQKRRAPYLGRFLAVWTVLSAVLVVMVFLL